MEEKKVCPHCGQRIVYDYGDITPMAKYVIELVAEGENVSVTGIKGRKRVDEIAIARHIYLFIMRELFPKTPLARIGETVGKHHTTVLHAQRNIKKYIEVDRNMEKRVRSYWDKAKSFADATHSQTPSPDQVGKTSESPNS